MAAVATASQHFFSRNSVELFDHDPGSTTADVTTTDGTAEIWRDMRGYEGFAIQAMMVVISSSSALVELEIVAASDSAGTADITEIKTSGTVDADAVGDFLNLECTAEELAQAGAASDLDLRYVAARLTLGASNTGECAVTYIRFGAKEAKLNLTPATTIA